MVQAGRPRLVGIPAGRSPHVRLSRQHGIAPASRWTMNVLLGAAYLVACGFIAWDWFRSMSREFNE